MSILHPDPSTAAPQAGKQHTHSYQQSCVSSPFPPTLPRRYARAVHRAKDDAVTKARTTVLGVQLVDGLPRAALRGAREGGGGREAVRDVLPGCSCWASVPGRGTRSCGSWAGRRWRRCGKGTARWAARGVGTWEEMDEFVRAFEGVCRGLSFLSSLSFPPLSSLPYV